LSHPAQFTSNLPFIVPGIIAALLLGACSGTTEDVRVTLCKDLVAVQTTGAGSPSWTETATETRGYQYAAVKLRWSAARGEGSAVCFYDHNAVDDTAMALADPLSSYATSPSKMLLNGNQIAQARLAQAIKQAMLKQGRSLVDDVRNAVK
jgi:hypothetical protein